MMTKCECANNSFVNCHLFGKAWIKPYCINWLRKSILIYNKFSLLTNNIATSLSSIMYEVFFKWIGNYVTFVGFFNAIYPVYCDLDNDYRVSFGLRLAIIGLIWPQINGLVCKIRYLCKVLFSYRFKASLSLPSFSKFQYFNSFSISWSFQWIFWWIIDLPFSITKCWLILPSEACCWKGRKLIKTQLLYCSDRGIHLVDRGFSNGGRFPITIRTHSKS